MINIQAKMTPIVVPVYELPELVEVETIYVMRQPAVESNHQVSQKSGRNLDEDKRPFSPDDKVMVNMETNTVDTNVPKRERAMQTEIKTTAEIGIQCKMDAFEERMREREREREWERECALQPESPQNKNPQDDDNFLLYVGQNTSMCCNGMLECLLCGEVAMCLREHQNHMILHYGPMVLCADCGKQLSHEFLLSQHSYSCPGRPNASSRPKIYIQCPHIRCNVMLTSKRELNKHLSKHLGLHSYHCMECRQTFSSSAQFLAHRQLESSCSKARHLYLAKDWSRCHRKKANLNRCTVCMKKFSNARLCTWHRRRCILAHHKRLRDLLCDVSNPDPTITKV